MYSRDFKPEVTDHKVFIIISYYFMEGLIILPHHPSLSSAVPLTGIQSLRSN